MTSDEAFEEIIAIWKQAGLTLQGARPWMEFFEVFKPPVKTDLERRMSVNFIHYRANYCQIVCGIMIFAIVTSRRALFGILLSMMISCAIFAVRMSSISLGDTSLPLTKRNRGFAAAGFSLVCLVFTGALLWLLMLFSLSLVLVLAHMSLRPRTLAAKYNATTTDLRQIFFGDGSTSASAEDAAEDGLAYESSAISTNQQDYIHSRRGKHAYSH